MKDGFKSIGFDANVLYIGFYYSNIFAFARY